MSNPKHIKDTLYPMLKEIFIRYLSRKHDKPYNQIPISEMAPEDLKLWQEIEEMNDRKVGVVYKDDAATRVVH
tara:strand:- start:138 stop:356 length:219 start_codon:yes stop_codon:yes gene_type:complete